MIYIDTGAFVARYIERDQFFMAATACWSEIKRASTRCITSSHVLSEAFTLLARRATYGFAADRARRLYSSSEIDVIRAGQEDETLALMYFERHAGQRISFTDCISFALMKRIGIKSAFTFDQDFSAAGFQVIPGSVK